VNEGGQSLAVVGMPSGVSESMSCVTVSYVLLVLVENVSTKIE